MDNPPGRAALDRGGKPEKLQVQRAFSEAAGRYDLLAGLQRFVADRLIGRVAGASIDAEVVLDVGTGTGYCVARLRELCPASQLMAVDLAEGMLHYVRRSVRPEARIWLVGGDAEALPFADGSVDLIVSNLALQWCPDPGAAFREFARVLRPNGCMFFSSFGESTLQELREAWSRVDEHSHVNVFHTMDELGMAMGTCGLDTLFLDKEDCVVEYPDVPSLMRELKGLGAHNVTANRPRHLVGKGVLARVISAYRMAHSTATGSIEASFEVIIGAAGRRRSR